MRKVIFYNPIGFYTLTLREIKRFMKVYFQTIFAPLITNMLFLGIFGGALRERNLGSQEFDYLSFLIPGLCALGAINSAFQNPASSLIIQKYQNTIADLNSYPLSTVEKLLAYLLSGTIRGLIVGILTYIASIPFIDYRIEHPIWFFLTIGIISWIFSAFGLIVGLFASTFDKLSFIQNFLITPLVYFSGVFFDLSKIPQSLKILVYLNPMVPLINISHYTYLGIHQERIIYDILAIALITGMLTILAYILLKKGVGLTE